MKSFIKEALESSIDAKPLVVIVTGNPKYLNNVKVKDMAETFYSDIKNILINKGYRVEFDPGLDYTHPDESAKAWIGHSRGIDRLRFAPKSVKTLELQTMDHGKKYNNKDDQGLDPDHYKLSPKDIKALDLL